MGKDLYVGTCRPSAPLDDKASDIRNLYNACAECHGTNGEGLVSRQAPKIAGLQPWYLERQLNNFRTGVRGNHPGDAYGNQMVVWASATLSNDEETKQLSAYIATLPRGPARPTLEADVGRGQKLYEHCAGCHGLRGEGNEDFNAPRLAGMDDWYLASQLRKFRSGVLGYSAKDGPGRQMVAALQGRVPDDAAMMAVVAYLNVLGTSD